MTPSSLSRKTSRPTTASSWFADQFGVPIPRGLREQADAMSWESFAATYGPNSGPLRLGDWACLDRQRPATRLGLQCCNFRAVIAVGDHISTSTATASGPVAALTAMLYERGIRVETLRFHQIPSREHTATFICGSNGIRSEWALGWSQEPTESALRAVIACANRLLTCAAPT
ncbi:homocitrate synthase [Mycobacterium heckeshornense]|nr:homocitrate synthase [Mycobacterium heckeshornense]KMV23211.1 homocitrate synthase [Mycobacterium heckeshornense]MCV7035305.1 homocitrate synthase [Mycobacterium heckeshornense]PIJ31904.1 homocitrate synthase [Mycobacterium heckeshornense]